MPPWASASTCTSTWRQPSRADSRNTPGWPKARRASARRGPPGVGQLLRTLDPADAPAAGPRPSLDQQRETQARGGARRPLEVGDLLAAPGDDGDAQLLSQTLGPHLVAQLPHGGRGGPDVDQAQPFQPLHEAGLFRDEAPARPGRLGARGAQGPLEQPLVGVGVAPCGPLSDLGRPQAEGLVGLAHEQGPAVGLREEGDALQALAVLVVVLAQRAQETQRGLAPVDDGHALEVRPHAASARAERLFADAPQARADRKVRRPSGSSGAGSATVR